MENLNAEQIKKALECHAGYFSCDECPYDPYEETGERYCGCVLAKHALALINSQEQRIKELAEENVEVKANWQKLKDSYDNNDKEWREAYADSQSKWEKSYEKLELTLEGVMHFVDKWLDGAELEQDEVNRAITMREKTLQIVENLKEKYEEAINQVNYIADVTRADTVRKVADLLWQGESEKLNISVGGKYYDKQEFINYNAKEMLEGEK